MGLSKTLIYLVFKGVSIGFTLSIPKYKYWLSVVNPHFPDATPINSYYFFNGLEEARLYPRGGETNVECIDKALKKAEKKFEEEKMWQKFKNKKIKISFED